MSKKSRTDFIEVSINTKIEKSYCICYYKLFSSLWRKRGCNKLA